KAPPTAVQAQSIIARTYALRNLRRFKIDNYELCATTQCQVYRGLDASTSSVDQAISATTGKVLTYSNELVDALYSSQTGGVTAQFEDVWEGQARPYLRSRIDAAPNQVWNLDNKPLSDEKNFRQFISLTKGFNEDTWSSFRWKRESPLTEINQNLREFLKAEQHPLANFGSVQNLVVAKRSRGGRVQQLKVMTDIGEVILQKDEILRALDAPNSLLFYVDPQSKSVEGESRSLAPGAVAASQQVLEGFTFAGGGLGHAVGLSQAGSYRLSNIGYSAEQILKFYYPGATLQPLTSSIVYWRDSQPSTVATQTVSAQPLSPATGRPGETTASNEAPKQDGPELFGVKLPNIKFNVLWDWLPFSNLDFEAGQPL
ncbi:MAG: SpoIID/LytB domain-containing protein, partial [Acaryochloridaceae cyanobacterium RL_2_7]|nr:SpoIID/LytB domain-containing protein [Acaryochloridaceae cyanobacterium RL_2_7]